VHNPEEIKKMRNKERRLQAIEKKKEKETDSLRVSNIFVGSDGSAIKYISESDEDREESEVNPRGRGNRKTTIIVNEDVNVFANIINRFRELQANKAREVDYTDVSSMRKIKKC
jgi:hypothetical protein